MSARRRLSTHEALAVPSRRELLELLRRRGGMDAHELAGALGLHVTTVRFHLEALAGAGLVHSATTPGAGRGRPRLVYRPAAPAGEESTGYPFLAGVLAEHLAEDEIQRGERAESAGYAWARGAGRGTDAEPVTRGLDAAVQEITERFEEMGFAPEQTLVGGEDYRIEMRSCPYRSLAERHPEVTCTLHRGLLRGMLSQGVDPEPTSELVPFASPDYCLVQITPIQSGQTAAS